MTSKLQQLLGLSLGLLSATSFALAATSGPTAIQSWADSLAAVETLTLTPLTPTHTLTPNGSHSEDVESKSRSKSESKSKNSESFRSPDSTATSGPVAIDRLIDFQQYRFGVPPFEFDYDAAAPSGPASLTNRPAWRTYVDPSAPSPRMVLIRSTWLNQGEQYPIAVLRDVTADNVNLAVGFKLLDGDTHRSAGLLWRARGTKDYRAVLVSALHREVRFLRLENGRATELAKASAAFDETEWSVLEVSVQGERVAVWLNERSALEARDSQPAEPGRVGLITAPDTVALFDDFHVWNGQERVQREPRPAPSSSPAPVLHVNEILTTHADFRTPCLSFRPGDPVRWRVQVADELQKPSPAASVECELVSPDGNVLDRDKAMTGTDGGSLFTRYLATNALPGVYTVRVKDITHADMPEATYSCRANLESAVTFKVGR